MPSTVSAQRIVSQTLAFPPQWHQRDSGDHHAIAPPHVVQSNRPLREPPEYNIPKVWTRLISETGLRPNRDMTKSTLVHHRNPRSAFASTQVAAGQCLDASLMVGWIDRSHSNLAADPEKPTDQTNHRHIRDRERSVVHQSPLPSHVSIGLS